MKYVLALFIIVITTIGFFLIATYFCCWNMQKQFDDYCREPYGFIDPSGAFCIKLNTDSTNNQPYQYKDPFSDGMCLVSNFETHAFNYMDNSGAYLFPPTTLYEASSFSGGLAAVKLIIQDNEQSSTQPAKTADLLAHKDNWIFIDKTGKQAIAGDYCDVGQFSNGLCPVREASSSDWHYIDKNGKRAFKEDFTGAGSFSGDRAAAARGSLWGVIDEHGHWLVAPTYRRAPQISSDGWIVCEDETGHIVNYLDKSGTSRLSLSRTPGDSAFHTCEIREFDPQLYECSKRSAAPSTSNSFPANNTLPSEGLVVMEQSGKYGYCDLDGKTIIPAHFDFCRPFAEGRAAVFDDSKRLFAYIDRSGALTTPYKFQQAYDYTEGFALVEEKDQDRLYFIDKEGVNKFGKTFMDAAPFQNGYAYVGKPMMAWP